ncbi:hypothetical protein DL767_000744 [Monosporascus sp. MG133]|nr:hypothetical protein DL767_000744 [Monosporascus sp. MG133]
MDVLMRRTTDSSIFPNLAPVLEAFAEFLDHGMAKGGRDRQQYGDILRLFQPRPGIVVAAADGDYRAGELTEQYEAAFGKFEGFCETQRTRYWWDLSDAVGSLRVVRAACPRIRWAIVEGSASTPGRAPGPGAEPRQRRRGGPAGPRVYHEAAAPPRAGAAYRLRPPR